MRDKFKKCILIVPIIPAHLHENLKMAMSKFSPNAETLTEEDIEAITGKTVFDEYFLPDFESIKFKPGTFNIILSDEEKYMYELYLYNILKENAKGIIFSSADTILEQIADEKIIAKVADETLSAKEIKELQKEDIIRKIQKTISDSNIFFVKLDARASSQNQINAADWERIIVTLNSFVKQNSDNKIIVLFDCLSSLVRARRGNILNFIEQILEIIGKNSFIISNVPINLFKKLNLEGADKEIRKLIIHKFFFKRE